MLACLQHNWSHLVKSEQNKGFYRIHHLQLVPHASFIITVFPRGHTERRVCVMGGPLSRRRRD